MIVDAIVLACDEADCIADVVAGIPQPPVRTVIVVANACTDTTADVARRAGATVVTEPRRGYGSACLAGMQALPADTEVVVFLGADGSDEPSLIPQLIRPILEGRSDIVVGSRAPELAEEGSLTRPQRIGNAIAAGWLRTRFGLHATDLGPFRAIRRSCLDDLNMSDTGYGWTVEMQIKVAQAGLAYVEVPVVYRRRQAGNSKISGTLVGTIGAAVKILSCLARHDVLRYTVGRNPTARPRHEQNKTAESDPHQSEESSR